MATYQDIWDCQTFVSSRALSAISIPFERVRLGRKYLTKVQGLKRYWQLKHTEEWATVLLSSSGQYQALIYT
jgi:hypothetical protein